MHRPEGWHAAWLAVPTGALLWWASSAASGRREAWDAPFYWTIAYPAALIVCAWLGWRQPERPWRWAPWLFFGQFIAMCLRNGEIGGLAPLGLVWFAVLSLPGMLAAQWAARLRHRD